VQRDILSGNPLSQTNNFNMATVASSIITISLWQPSQSSPIQKWTFAGEPTIGVGRAPDNHVILYSSVVSRHHVKIENKNNHWEIVNLGNNGTYLNGKPIEQVTVVDGMHVCLAVSGPQLQINLGSTTQKPLQKTVPLQHLETPSCSSMQDTFIRASSIKS
jgi:pSer/pThr/pTyr-binding forkhead associated (FHA) protein